VAGVALAVMAMYTNPVAAATSNAIRGTTVRTANGVAHYLPTVAHQSKPKSIQNLNYHGGKIMKKSFTYAIYWDPPTLQNGNPSFFSAQYQTIINRYFNDVGGQPIKSLYGNNTQYYQSPPLVHIKNISSLAGTFVDTHAFPASGCTDSATPGNCLSDSQIQAEVSHARSVNGWSAGAKNMFFVFTPKGEGSCFNNSSSCAFTVYCAYHGSFGNTIYANMPYGNTFNGNCTTLSQFPNDADADVEISITSHEHMEAVTDPNLNAWYDSSGEEIGDLCAYNYGSITLDGGKANEQWNGHFYVVQQEWDNAVSGCVQKGP
jgi:hypothetical protein